MGHIFETDPQKSPLLLYSLISGLHISSHHFSSQVPLSCPYRLAILFRDFDKPHHSNILCSLLGLSTSSNCYPFWYTSLSLLLQPPKHRKPWKALIRYVSLGNDWFPKEWIFQGWSQKHISTFPEKKDDSLRDFSAPCFQMGSEFYLAESLLKSHCFNTSRGISIV